MITIYLARFSDGSWIRWGVIEDTKGEREQGFKRKARRWADANGIGLEYTVIDG